MKNSTKLKLALLKEFGAHTQGPIEKYFDEEGENDVRFGNEKHRPHREEQEYGMCQECGVPAMYEGMCQECGYMEEGRGLEEDKHEVFMAQKNLETIVKAATELMHKLGEEEREVPAWVADHITKAETYIEQANDGFYFEDEEEQGHNDDMSLSALMEKSNKKPKKWIQKAINPAHKGDLHSALHVSKDKKIPASKLNKATHSKDSHIRHMAQFAKNIRSK
jgi:hypothetical protein